MINEKKIEIAAVKHSADDWISDDCRTAFEDGFVQGINWLKKHIWHDIFEAPKEPGRIVFDRGMYEPVTYQFSFNELQEWERLIPRYARKWSYYCDLFCL